VTTGSSLITGINGFVGRYLAEHLISAGKQVTGLDLVPSQQAENWDVHFCDLLDFDGLSQLLSELKPRHVYHLAGLVSPADSIQRPRDYFLVNVQGTVNLLEALRTLDIATRVLIVSSSKVYGAPSGSELISETADPAPETPYASSKDMAELAAIGYYERYDVEAVIARPFNHTGPGQPTGFVLPDFCHQIASLEAQDPRPKTQFPRPKPQDPRLATGNLSGTLDLTDVRDVVRAYSALLEKGKAGEVYNVCSGKGTRVRRLLELVMENSSLKDSIEIPSQEEPTTNIAHVGSNTKLKDCTAWQPDIPLSQTITDTLSYWRHQLQT